MFKKILINIGGILSSRILGFIRDMLTASILGANIYSDIFFIAFKFPNLFRRLVAEGAFTQALLPALELAKNPGGLAYRIGIKFFQFILILSLIITLAQGIVAKIIAIGYPEEIQLLSSPLIALNFWYLDFIFVVTFLGSLLQRRGYFTIPAFSPALLNLSLIGALLLIWIYRLSPIEGIYLLSGGVLVGGALQLLFHLWGAVKFGIWKELKGGRDRELKGHPTEIKKGLKGFYSHFWNSVWGSSTAQISAFIDTWLATFLTAGSVSYLYYSNRLFQLPFALFVIATSTVFFPKITKLLHKNPSAGNRLLLTTTTYLLPVLGFTTALAYNSSLPIVQFLFERGAFTGTDAQITAQLVELYLLGLLPFGIGKLFTSYLYGKHLHRKVALYSTISVSLNIALSAGLIWSIGIIALPLATTIGGMVLLCLTFRELPSSLKRALALNWKGWGWLTIGIGVGYLLSSPFSTLLNWIKGLTG